MHHVLIRLDSHIRCLCAMICWCHHCCSWHMSCHIYQHVLMLVASQRLQCPLCIATFMDLRLYLAHIASIRWLCIAVFDSRSPTTLSKHNIYVLQHAHIILINLVLKLDKLKTVSKTKFRHLSKTFKFYATLFIHQFSLWITLINLYSAIFLRLFLFCSQTWNRSHGLRERISSPHP